VRSIGMDVHRSFAQIAVVEDGLCRDEGRIGVKAEDLREWAMTLEPDDEIALEATTNGDAIATMLRPLVGRVVVSNPRKTRAIAEAKVKTDKVDVRILAQLLAADFTSLKERHDELHVIGSVNLVQSLLRFGLVDRLELWMYPVLLGSGKQVFSDGGLTP
jgi:riboflavin biosynthesis pyrimidine reductase